MAHKRTESVPRTTMSSIRKIRSVRRTGHDGSVGCAWRTKRTKSVPDAAVLVRGAHPTSTHYGSSVGCAWRTKRTESVPRTTISSIRKIRTVRRTGYDGSVGCAWRTKRTESVPRTTISSIRKIRTVRRTGYDGSVGCAWRTKRTESVPDGYAVLVRGAHPTSTGARCTPYKYRCAVRTHDSSSWFAERRRPKGLLRDSPFALIDTFADKSMESGIGSIRSEHSPCAGDSPPRLGSHDPIRPHRFE